MPQDPQKDQHIEGSSIEESQVQLGQAEGDTIQIQGSGNQVIIHRADRNAAQTGKLLSRRAYRNRQVLLNKVRNFWVKGILEHSLYKGVQLELDLEERWDALALDYASLEHPRQSLPKGTKALDKFDELGAGCTLLILGEPGSGKTTTLLELARDSIARAEQDVDLPIPVVFNLSSWSIFNRTARKLPTLKDWLVDELITKYQVSKALAKNWLTDQELLLLLDGLDEVRVEQRDACVQAINEFHQAHGLTEIVVCSRIKDYEALANLLRFQGAIFIQPLTAEQVETYLNEAGNVLAGVKIAWRIDPVLQELTQTPLMLNVIALAYEGFTSEELPKMPLVKLRQDLFDKYIDRMLEHRTIAYRYPKKKTKHWLVWLAQQMVQTSQTVFLIERLQPIFLTTRLQRWFYNNIIWSSIGTFSTILVTFSIGIIWLLLTELTSELYVESRNPDFFRFMIATGIISGILSGILGSIFIRFKRISNQNKKFKYVNLNLGNGLIFGSLLGIISCLVVFLNVIYEIITSSNLDLNITSDFKFMIFFPLLIFIPFGILYGIVGTTIGSLNIGYIEVFEKVEFSVRRSIFFGLVSSLFLGIIVHFIVFSRLTLIFAISGVVTLSGVFVEGLTIGTIVGVSGGLAIGIISGFSSSRLEVIMQPNQGIWKSLKSAIYSSFTGVLSLGVAFYLAFGFSRAIAVPFWGLKEILPLSIFGLLFGLAGGGLACFQHFVLRTILCCSENIPWNYSQFLDWCCSKLLLQRVGGGYTFVHRSLMEHFAQMEVESER